MKNILDIMIVFWLFTPFILFTYFIYYKAMTKILEIELETEQKVTAWYRIELLKLKLGVDEDKEEEKANFTEINKFN